MSIWVSVVGFVEKLFEPAVKALDEYIFTDQEKEEVVLQKEKIKAEIEKAKIALSQKLLEQENKVIEAQRSIIVAEARGDSWLQRNWRPSFMILFGAIIAAYFFGFTPPTSEKLVMRLLDIVQGGLYGYMGLRSVEKISDVIKKRKVEKQFKKLNKIDRMEADI